MYVVRQPDLEDWYSMKELWEELRDSAQSQHVEADVKLLKEYLKASFSTPLLNIWGAFQDGWLCLGLVITQIITHPEVRNSQVVNTPSLFIRAVYTRKGSPPSVGQDLDKSLLEFCKASGCVTITGACRTDFPVEAAKRRHGYTASHIILSKVV